MFHHLLSTVGSIHSFLRPLFLQASKKWRENQLDLSRQKATAQLSSMNAATAQLVTLTSGDQDEVDYTAVGAAVNQM